jgi:hypothetical protein
MILTLQYSITYEVLHKRLLGRMEIEPASNSFLEKIEKGRDRGFYKLRQYKSDSVHVLVKRNVKQQHH